MVVIVTSIRRTWTNFELYRLVVKPCNGDDSAKIKVVIWEKHLTSHISEQLTEIDAVIVCRSIEDCNLSAAPESETPVFFLVFFFFCFGICIQPTNARAETGTAIHN
jgi:hypothetical protein